MKISGAIFVLDGTLLDSMWVWDNLIPEALEEKGVVMDDELNKKLDAMSVRQGAEYICRHYLPNETADTLIDFMWKRAEHQYENVVVHKHGVKPFLFALRNKGVRMVVATASKRSLAEAALRRLNLLHYFSVILSCDDMGVGKESPEIYEKALDILGTPKETTYVFEDALHCVITAKKAGFPVVAVKEATSAHNEEKIRELADIFIKDYDDFRGMV